MRPAGTFYLARGSPLEKKFFSIDLVYLFNLGATQVPVHNCTTASDRKSRCNTPESNFSLTFYDKTAGTLVSNRSVELQVS